MLAQSVWAQLPTVDDTGAAGWLSDRDDPFRGRFERFLIASPTRDYAAGFSLAHEAGRPAVPMLWQMLLEEKSNAVRRGAVLAAAMVAGGPMLDVRLFEWLGQQKAIKEERTMAALAVAMGAPRRRSIADFWSHSLGPERSPEEILAIAVRLAAARIPEASEGAPTLAEDDIGLVAATAFAGLPVPASIRNRRWDLRQTGRHDDLFWRGALLAGTREVLAGREAGRMLLEYARRMARLGDQFAAARQASACFRARADTVEAEGVRPDYPMLRQLACNRQSAQRLARWLDPVPQPRDEQPQRLAVSYVLSRTPGQVVADRELWGRDDRISAHVAVALAWRLLEQDQPRIEDVELAGVAEWQLVRWAAGQRVVGERCDDELLSTMLQLAIAGRLPRAAARVALEETLWRWQSHPGLGLLEVEQLLIRDLLLVGSNPGGKYMSHVPFERRYRPKGIGHSSAFFETAVAFYDFMRTPRLPLPPLYRLR